MKGRKAEKFWVHVIEVRGHDKHEHDVGCFAVYGSMDDAEEFAYNRMCAHRSGYYNIVEIYDEGFKLLKKYEV